MTIKGFAIDDPAYPARLKNIYDPPQVLYVNGTVVAQDEIAVAIVGSRRASPYGLETAERLAYELAARGVTVVSGMARGIDGAAHRGALAAGGRTIAVMGSGHHDIYPPEHTDLYNDIIAHGAVVTEFENDVPPIPRNFPRRNRIISGLSLGVVVVEAARNSGALITARLALEQGRDVFAVPGKVSSATSWGTNALIKDGAALVGSADDILEALSIRPIAAPSGTPAHDPSIERMTKAYIYNALTADERTLYKLLSDEPIYIDELVAQSGMPAGAAAKILLQLQLKKVITEMPGKYFIRANRKE